MRDKCSTCQKVSTPLADHRRKRPVQLNRYLAQLSDHTTMTPLESNDVISKVQTARGYSSINLPQVKDSQSIADYIESLRYDNLKDLMEFARHQLIAQQKDGVPPVPIPTEAEYCKPFTPFSKAHPTASRNYKIESAEKALREMFSCVRSRSLNKSRDKDDDWFNDIVDDNPVVQAGFDLFGIASSSENISSRLDEFIKMGHPLMEQLSTIREIANQASGQAKDAIDAGSSLLTKGFLSVPLVVYLVILSYKYTTAKKEEDRPNFKMVILFMTLFGSLIFSPDIYKALITFMDDVYTRLERPAEEEIIMENTEDDVPMIQGAFSLPNDFSSSAVALIGAIFLGSSWNSISKSSVLSFVRDFDKHTSSVDKLINYLMKIIMWMINWGRENIFGFDPIKFTQFADSVLNTWCDKTQSLVELNGQGKLTLSRSNCLLVNSLYLEGLNLTGSSRSYLKEPAIRSALGVHMSAIKNLQVKFSAVNIETTGPRIRPLSIMFSGGSGVGKSYLVNPFVIDLTDQIMTQEQKMLWGDSYMDRVYVRNPGVPFWERYIGQMVCIWDELFQIKEGYCEYSAPGEWISAVNEFPFCLNMAGLEQKGNVYFNSQIAIATTNKEKPNFESIICDNAVWNRVDYLIRVYPKKEYSLNKVDKYADRKIDTGHPEILEAKGNFLSHIYELHQVDKDGNILQILSYEELVTQCISTYKKKNANSTNYIEQMAQRTKPEVQAGNPIKTVNRVLTKLQSLNPTYQSIQNGLVPGDFLSRDNEEPNIRTNLPLKDEWELTPESFAIQHRLHAYFSAVQDKSTLLSDVMWNPTMMQTIVEHEMDNLGAISSIGTAREPLFDLTPEQQETYRKLELQLPNLTNVGVGGRVLYSNVDDGSGTVIDIIGMLTMRNNCTRLSNWINERSPRWAIIIKGFIKTQIVDTYHRNIIDEMPFGYFLWMLSQADDGALVRLLNDICRDGQLEFHVEIQTDPQLAQHLVMNFNPAMYRRKLGYMLVALPGDILDGVSPLKEASERMKHFVTVGFPRFVANSFSPLINSVVAWFSDPMRATVTLSTMTIGIPMFLSYFDAKHTNNRIANDVHESLAQSDKPLVKQVYSSEAKLQSESGELHRQYKTIREKQQRTIRNRYNPRTYKTQVQYGLQDSNANDVKNKLLNKSMYCFAFEEDLSKIVGHALFIRANEFIINAHYHPIIIDALEQDPRTPSDRMGFKSHNIVLYNPNRKHEPDWHEIKVSYLDIANAQFSDEIGDACLVRATGFKLNFPDISDYFCEEEFMQQDKIVSAALIKNLPSEKWISQVNARFDGEIECGMEGADHVFYNPQIITYRAPTNKGDCGSVLIINNASHQGGKIIGIHCAGTPSGIGLSVPISREKLKQLINRGANDLFMAFKDSEEDGHGDKMLTFYGIEAKTGEDVIYPSMGGGPNCKQGNDVPLIQSGVISHVFNPKTYSRTLDNSIVFPHKTQFIHSEFFGLWGETSRGLANHRQNVEQPDGHFLPITVHNILQYGNVVDVGDSIIIERAMLSMKKHFLKRSAPVTSFHTKPVTWNVAVNGDKADPYCNSMIATTSPGYPYIWTHKSRGKYNWLEVDLVNGGYCMEKEELKELIRQAAVKIQDMHDGKHPEWVYIDYPKDEKLPKHKTATKLRFFAISPFDMSLIWRKYYLRMGTWFMHNKLENSLAIGINCYSMDWDYLARKLLSRNKKGIFCIDYHKFDKMQIPRFMKGLYSHIIKSLFMFGCISPFHEMVRSTLWSDLIYSNHLFIDKVYQWIGSLPSGHAWTVFINSLMNLAYFVYCWEIMAPDEFKDKFFEFVTIFVYGDDGIGSICQSVVSWYNPITIMDAMSSINQNLTPASKNGKMVAFVPLHEATFLKRGFRKSILGDRYIAPLELSVVLDLPYWTKRGVDSHNIALVNIETALLELSLHEHSLWESYAPRMIRAYEEAAERSPPYSSYSESQRVCLGVDTWW